MSSSDVAKQDGKRRARVVVLGEFSAGKSTLINLMTGERSLRTQVTATQMPAVWMSYGDDAPYRVDLDGKQHPVDPSAPETISVADTAYVRTFMKAPALELCDLIDTPGNSDPNIPSIAWERVAELADVAIWCSPSTQAWRQSELSAWRGVPEHIRARSILLLTRADKLRSDTDREKVLRRIKREASDLFSHIHMASLLEFENASDVLKDLIKLCNSVKETENQDTNVKLDLTAPQPIVTAAPVAEAQTPSDDLDDEFSAEDIAMTLEDLAATEDTSDADAALDALTIPIEFEIPEEAPTPKRQGHATAMWARLSKGVAASDTDSMNAVLDNFLEKLDSEFDALHAKIDMKEAG